MIPDDIDDMAQQMMDSAANKVTDPLTSDQEIVEAVRAVEKMFNCQIPKETITMVLVDLIRGVR